MPALANMRHERFCRALIKTNIAARAYLKAGYEVTTPRALYVNASRLLTHANVKRRIRELQRQMASRNRITVDSLVEELDEAKRNAQRLEQPATEVSAILAKAKLTGLLVDRKESGDPGAFAGLQSEADIIATVQAELGPDAARQLAKALEHAASSEPAKPAEAAEPNEADTVAAITTLAPGTRH